MIYYFRTPHAVPESTYLNFLYYGGDAKSFRYIVLFEEVWLSGRPPYISELNGCFEVNTIINSKKHGK